MLNRRPRKWFWIPAATAGKQRCLYMRWRKASWRQPSAWKKWWKTSRSYRGQRSPSASYFCGWVKPSEFTQRKTRGPPRCSPRGCKESDTTQLLNNNDSPCSEIAIVAAFTEIPVSYELMNTNCRSKGSGWIANLLLGLARNTEMPEGWTYCTQRSEMWHIWQQKGASLA